MPTAGLHIDLLADLLLIWRLPQYHVNIGKRRVKSPKTYVSDNSLAQALLCIESHEVLIGHHVAESSREGFFIETLLAAAPEHVQASLYRITASAALIRSPSR